MVNENQTGRHLARVATLPVILVISLTAAWLVTTLKTGIRLSLPIELSWSGLSLSMPEGNGWQCANKWTLKDYGFSVGSVFLFRRDAGRSYARCRYLLASKDETPDERFNNEAEALGGEVIETGRMAAGKAKQPDGGLVVDWGLIKGEAGRTQRIPFEIILGVCRLPAGRQLEIEVLTSEDANDLAKNTFNAIIGSIEFSDNGLLQAGNQIIVSLREDGLDNVLNDDDRLTSLFLITGTKGQTIGFTMGAMAAEPDKEPAIKAASYYYRRAPLSYEEVSFFRSDRSFEKFTWKVENESGARYKGIEMSAEAGRLVSRGQDREKEFLLGEGAFPDMINEQVLRKFIDSNQNAILADLIMSDATITPVYIEKIEPQQPDGYAVGVEVLDGRGIRQQIYYDGSKKQTKTILSHEDTLIFTYTPSTAEEIARQIPERADLVLKREQLLDRQGI